MNIFSFGAEFTDEESCHLHFKNSVISMEWSATAANQPTIIGLSTSGAISASPARRESPCAVEPSWKARSCPS
jgi:hypothetical protein